MSNLRTSILAALGLDPAEYVDVTDEQIADLVVELKTWVETIGASVESIRKDVQDGLADNIRTARELRRLAEVSPELADKMRHMADRLATEAQAAEYEARYGPVVGDYSYTDPLTELLDAVFSKQGQN